MVTGDGQGVIRVGLANGGEPHLLFGHSSSFPPNGLAVSPDGRRLVFSTSRYGASEIWSVEIESREVFPLVRNPETGYDPVYAPGGRSVYFSARSRQVNGLWRIPVSPKTGRPAGPPEQIANLGLASIRHLAVRWVSMPPRACRGTRTCSYSRSPSSAMPRSTTMTAMNTLTISPGGIDFSVIPCASSSSRGMSKPRVKR